MNGVDRKWDRIDCHTFGVINVSVNADETFVTLNVSVNADETFVTLNVFNTEQEGGFAQIIKSSCSVQNTLQSHII